MGIISRFGDIMKANINDLLSKCEDPEKMIEQSLRDLNADLVKVKNDTATLMANEKHCKDMVDEYTVEVARWDEKARLAIKAGNDEDARVFLSKKQKEDAKLKDAIKVWDTAKADADKMRKMHDKLVSDIAELEQSKESIVSKIQLAETQESMNKFTSSANIDSHRSTFDRMEQKVNNRLNKAEAVAELESSGVDEAETLANKYDTGNSDSSIEAELRALKSEMGM